MLAGRAACLFISFIHATHFQTEHTVYLVQLVMELTGLR